MSKELKLLAEYHKGRVDCSEVQVLALVPEYLSKWYFSEKELEVNSPSRMDGIDWKMENDIRQLYCSFIIKLGQELRVPQLTIATAIMFCHRFYMRQSLAKNDWQTVATACMFLAAKSEETPCFLDKVVVLAYRLVCEKDLVAAQRIQSKAVFAKQKELIWTGERLLLSTIAYDLNIQHPYKPLVSAMKRFGLPREVVKVAWNFVNDWLQTTLCLQYKPHYIAAGSLYLAAKLNNLKIKCWWQAFEVAPSVLEEAIQKMVEMLGNKRVSAVAPNISLKTGEPPSKETVQSLEADTSSPESCIASQAGSSDSSSPVFIELTRVGEQMGDQNNGCGGTPSVKNISTQEKPLLEHPKKNSEHLRCVIHGIEDPRGTNGGGDPWGRNGGEEPVEMNRSEELQEGGHGEVASNSVSSQVGGMRSLDIERIREKLRRRRREREHGTLVVSLEPCEDFLERELESCIEIQMDVVKRPRKITVI